MRFSIFITVLLFIAACDGRQSLRMEKDGPRSFLTAAASPGEQDEGNAGVSLDRMLIREATINFQCANVLETKRKLDALVKSYKGYSTNEGQNTYDDRTYYNQTFRVPASALDSLIAKIERLALTIDDKNISSEDVTEEFIDVSARLSTKKELEARYGEILKSARTVEEIIAVERELNNVRSEIESMEGRVNYLQNRVQLSTLHVSYYLPEAGTFTFGSKFMNAFGIGWNNLLSFIIGIFQAWPFVIMIVAGIWATRKYLWKGRGK